MKTNLVLTRNTSTHVRVPWEDARGEIPSPASTPGGLLGSEGTGPLSATSCAAFVYGTVVNMRCNGGMSL